MDFKLYRSQVCVTHDFVLDDRGHYCRRCGLREEIVNGSKFVFDPRIPEGGIRFVQDGYVVGRIVGLP